MERIKHTPENSQIIIDKALTVLKNGGILVFPTETCYGLGVDATNQAAIDKLAAWLVASTPKP